MNKKDNSGFRRTHSVIAAQLMRLCREKDISRVTVQELCRAAGVNRSTFYAHFQDLYAVMEWEKDRQNQEVARLLRERSAQTEGGLSFPDFLEVILTHVRENRDFYRIYLSRSSLQYLQDGFRQLREAIMEPAFRYYNVPEIDRKYYSCFFLAGYMNVIRLWLEGGCAETPEHISNLLIAQMPSTTETAFQLSFHDKT